MYIYIIYIVTMPLIKDETNQMSNVSSTQQSIPRNYLPQP